MPRFLQRPKGAPALNIETELRRLREKNIPRTVAAELLGMTYPRFCRLIRLHNIDWPKWAGSKRITVDGITATIGEHARRLGINPKNATFRASSGLEIRQARIFITPEKVARYIELRRAGVAPNDAAARVGHSYSRLHIRAKRISPEYRALLAPQART